MRIPLPCRRRAAAALTLLAVGLAGAARAADQTLVGVDKVRFAWSPASGSPGMYLVSRSLNGGALQSYAVTVTPSVDIPVTPGQSIAIAVTAAGYDSAGMYRVGPQSPLSDRITVVAAPRFPAATGAWLLRCASCPSLARRPLADASGVEVKMRALTAPWRILGHFALSSNRDAIVWHNPLTGEFALYDADLLTPIPGAVGLGPLVALRGIGGADFDGDGAEDFLLQRDDTGEISAWRLTAGGFAKIAVVPGPADSDLVAAADFDRDGRPDLVFHDPVTGDLDTWFLRGDPTTGAKLSSWVASIFSAVIPDGTDVVATGDYDGDGYRDQVWRTTDGHLTVRYLVSGRLVRYLRVPYLTGDEVRDVLADSFDIDGVPGDEIGLAENPSQVMSVVFPARGGTRITVLNPGSSWRAFGVAP